MFAVWGGRSETVDAVVERLAATLKQFASGPLGGFGGWSDVEDGRSADDLRGIVGRAVQRDADGRPAPELGFGISLATGDPHAPAGSGAPRAVLGVSAGLTVGGPHAPANRVVLTFSNVESLDREALRAARRTIIDAWAPLVALIDTVAIARTQRFIRLEPPLGFETWFAPAILDAVPAVPGLSGRPEAGGILIELPEWTESAVTAARAALLASGAARPIPPDMMQTPDARVGP